MGIVNNVNLSYKITLFTVIFSDKIAPNTMPNIVEGGRHVSQGYEAT